MTTKTIYDGILPLYAHFLHDDPALFSVHAVVPESCNGMTVHMIDWKISDDWSSVTVRYQTGDGGAWAAIHESTFPCVREETPLKKPRKRGPWTWAYGEWQHARTGVRIHPSDCWAL